MHIFRNTFSGLLRELGKAYEQIGGALKHKNAFTETTATYCAKDVFSTLQDSAAAAGWPEKAKHRRIGRHTDKVPLPQEWIHALAPNLQSATEAVLERERMGMSVDSEKAFLELLPVMLTVFLAEPSLQNGLVQGVLPHGAD